MSLSAGTRLVSDGLEFRPDLVDHQASARQVEEGTVLMRSCVLTILTLLILTCVAASQSSPQDEMLEIKGVQLRLGMDENTVTQKLRERNFGVREVSKESLRPGQKIWILCESPDDKNCDPVLGEVGFSNGHVSVVTKRWAETNSAAEVVAALYGAAKDLQGHGFTHCQLASRETFDPGYEVQYVEMKCAEHLSLSVTHSHSTKVPSSVLVEEQLVLSPSKP